MTPDTAALLSASLGINFRARAPPPGRPPSHQRREAVCVISHQVPSPPSRQCLVGIMTNLLLRALEQFPCCSNERDILSLGRCCGLPRVRVEQNSSEPLPRNQAPFFHATREKKTKNKTNELGIQASFGKAAGLPALIRTDQLDSSVWLSTTGNQVRDCHTRRM